MNCSIKPSLEKIEILVLVGTAIKALKQAAEMKHKLSACIVHSVCVCVHASDSTLLLLYYYLFVYFSN